MATKTQAEVVALTRQKLNQLHTRRYTDEYIRGWINEAQNDIARRTECLRAFEFITIVVGTGSYDAPDDVVRIHQVSYTDTSASIFDLQYIDQKNITNVAGNNVAINEGRPVIYTTWGYPPELDVVIYPKPAEGGVLTIWYYKTPTPLATANTDDATTPIDLPMGWEDLTVDYSVYQALLSDADPRWSEYFKLYEAKLAGLNDAAVRFNDQAGMIVDGAAMVPEWLYSFDD